MKVGVFLARMQPIHNAHVYMVNKALEENDKVLIVLGSDNKRDMLRNPFPIELREEIIRKVFSNIDKDRLVIASIPDWSMETDYMQDKIWGRYLYYNIVSRIEQKRFSLYYNDGVETLDKWFNDTEIRSYITYRTFERGSMFNGLSATKIRNALIENNKEYINKYCPSIVSDEYYEILRTYYKNVKINPKKDFSMD